MDRACCSPPDRLCRRRAARLSSSSGNSPRHAGHGPGPGGGAAGAPNQEVLLLDREAGEDPAPSGDERDCRGRTRRWGPGHPGSGRRRREADRPGRAGTAGRATVRSRVDLPGPRVAADDRHHPRRGQPRPRTSNQGLGSRRSRRLSQPGEPPAAAPPRRSPDRLRAPGSTSRTTWRVARQPARLGTAPRSACGPKAPATKAVHHPHQGRDDVLDPQDRQHRPAAPRSSPTTATSSLDLGPVSPPAISSS
jgi:hypothetical protein